MMRGHELGQIKRRAASPTCCSSTAIRWPTSPSCRSAHGILAVMKDGVFHAAAADQGGAQTRWSASVA